MGKAKQYSIKAKAARFALKFHMAMTSPPIFLRGAALAMCTGVLDLHMIFAAFADDRLEADETPPARNWSFLYGRSDFSWRCI
ncbi:hypothetical protein ACCT00_31585 [Rhizobium ruizarguesonis]